MNHELRCWLFFAPWWYQESPVQVLRATMEDAYEGSWPDDGPHVTVSLDEIERWIAERGGWYRRTVTSIEWLPPSGAVDFEARVRWT